MSNIPEDKSLQPTSNSLTPENSVPNVIETGSDQELLDLAKLMVNRDDIWNNVESWDDKLAYQWWQLRLPDDMTSRGHPARFDSGSLKDNWYYINWNRLKKSVEMGTPILASEQDIRNHVIAALQKNTTCCNCHNTSSASSLNTNDRQRNLNSSLVAENPYLQCHQDLLPPINPSEYNYMSQGTFARPITNQPSVSTADSFEVLLSRDDFKFSCGHFVVFPGFRERLHGHNYRVGVRIIGRLNSDGYVIDFGEVKGSVRRVCRQLNEHVLLPQLEPDGVLRITMMDEVKSIKVEVRCSSSNEWLVYQFPRDDVILLPIHHTTAEEIARYLFKKILIELGGKEKLLCRGARVMEVIVSEVPGQQASYRHTIDDESMLL